MDRLIQVVRRGGEAGAVAHAVELREVANGLERGIARDLAVEDLEGPVRQERTLLRCGRRWTWRTERARQGAKGLWGPTAWWNPPDTMDGDAPLGARGRVSPSS